MRVNALWAASPTCSSTKWPYKRSAKESADSPYVGRGSDICSAFWRCFLRYSTSETDHCGPFSNRSISPRGPVTTSPGSDAAIFFRIGNSFSALPPRRFARRKFVTNRMAQSSSSPPTRTPMFTNSPRVEFGTCLNVQVIYSLTIRHSFLRSEHESTLIFRLLPYANITTWLLRANSYPNKQWSVILCKPQ